MLSILHRLPPSITTIVTIVYISFGFWHKAWNFDEMDIVDAIHTSILLASYFIYPGGLKGKVALGGIWTQRNNNSYSILFFAGWALEWDPMILQLCQKVEKMVITSRNKLFEKFCQKQRNRRNKTLKTSSALQKYTYLSVILYFFISGETQIWYVFLFLYRGEVSYYCDNADRLKQLNNWLGVCS